MPKGLNVNRVVRVNVNLAPLAAQFRNFGSLLILASDPIIDVQERIREYEGLDDIAVDFGTNSPAYLAADLFFSQVPKPALVYVGRWAQTATHGIAHGAILTPTQRLLANFTAVTSGAMLVAVDGVPYSLTGLNFSAATNLNGIASIVQAALISAGATGATVVWDANTGRFDITSASTGVLSTVGLSPGPTASSRITFTTNPVAASTVTLNGTATTFVASNPTGPQVLIGPDLATTLQNFRTYAQTSTDVQLLKFRYGVDATRLYLSAAAPGVGGNSLTVATTVTGATVLVSPMSGGTGTDVSALMGLNVGNASVLPPVDGVAAETLASCVANMADISGDWYGLMVATATPPTLADHEAVAAFIEGAEQSHIYGITTQDTSVLLSTQTNDIASIMQSFEYMRTFVQYSSSSPYAVASMFGRAFTVDFNGSLTTITLKFKQEPGVVAEYLTASQATTLKAKNCNVFVRYQNNTAIIQEGTMANGYFFDEVHGADWLANYVQNNVYNVLYQSATKVSQTDTGTHRLVVAIENSLSQAVTNGWVAPGQWNADGFGALAQGDTLPRGFYVYAPPVATQAQADREARKSVPIQAAAKLAGAIHSVDVAINCNR